MKLLLDLHLFLAEMTIGNRIRCSVHASLFGLWSPSTRKVCCPSSATCCSGNHVLNLDHANRQRLSNGSGARWHDKAMGASTPVRRVALPSTQTCEGISAADHHMRCGAISLSPESTPHRDLLRWLSVRAPTAKHTSLAIQFC